MDNVFIILSINIYCITEEPVRLKHIWQKNDTIMFCQGGITSLLLLSGFKYKKDESRKNLIKVYHITNKGI